MNELGKCRPFLKWAGGKTQLLEKLRSKLPNSYARYFEPMVGGGALFFSLAASGATPIAHLSDINSELINTYIAIRDNVEEVIELLSTYERSKQQFDALRNLDRNPDFNTYSIILRAARLIYLNKTCFNGLYRVNSRGEFNAPFGKSTSAILDRENLRNCSRALQNTILTSSPFADIESSLQPEDFIYLDPPYIPLTETAKFTEYSSTGFSIEHHRNLSEFCRRISERGVRFMLSNADTAGARELYSGFNIESVIARRRISAKNAGRGSVGEVIITNY